MPTSQLRDMMRSGAWARIGFGAAMLALPGVMARGWIGADGASPGVKAIMRGLGVRDVILGLGQLYAADDGRDVQRWARLGMAADGVDALATLLAARHLRARNVVFLTAVAGSAVALQAWIVQRLGDETVAAIPEP